MKKRFSDEQIISILREAEAGVMPPVKSRAGAQFRSTRETSLLISVSKASGFPMVINNIISEITF